MAIYRAKQWIDLPTDCSISELMLENVNNTPSDKVIFEDTLNGRTATYGGFREQVKKSAFWLKNTIGFQPGQTITIISPSCIDYLIVAHSVWWIGGVVSTINSALNAREIQHGFDLLEPDFLVIHDSIFETIPPVLDSYDKPLRVLTIGKSKVKTSALHLLTLGAVRRKEWTTFPTEPSKALTSSIPEPYSLKGKDASKFCASIVLSSGTTGSSKAVMLSHFNLVSTCKQLRADNPDNWRQSQREIFFPPLSHIYGLYVCGTMCSWIGAYVCMVPRFELEQYCRLMSERKATLARLVPPIAKQLAENSIVQKYTYPSLEYFSCSAAPLKEKLAHDLSAKFPDVVVAQTWGCTELSGAIVQAGARNKGMPINATGTVIANIEMRFVDEEGKDTGPRGPGEIVARGPNVMMGYKNNATATAEAIDKDGWYRTGDLGYMDPNGYIMIYDRTKDVIKYKGFQVSPAELEELLFQHPCVLDVAVIGRWSTDEATELPMAFVVSKTALKDQGERENCTRELIELVKGKVAGYKQLRGGVVYMDALPRNPTGKILRRVLRAELEKKEAQTSKL